MGPVRNCYYTHGVHWVTAGIWVHADIESSYIRDAAEVSRWQSSIRQRQGGKGPRKSPKHSVVHTHDTTHYVYVPIHECDASNLDQVCTHRSLPSDSARTS